MTGMLAALRRRRLGRSAALAGLLMLALGPLVHGQQSPARLSFGGTEPPLAEPPVKPPPADPPGRTRPDDVQPASCVNCNSGGLISPYGGHVGTAGCSNCARGMPCVPGRERCPEHEEPRNCCDRFFACFYDCICCPDPCYEGKWTPIADAAFYVDAARPQTQTRIRVDPGLGLVLPDRAEFFWARADGNGLGPKTPAPYIGERHVDYVDTFLYTEAATGRVGVFFEMSYRSLDPALVPHAAGFGDMFTGMKTLLLDCELLQLSMQFKTYIPVGSAGKGLGTGHVSLEPSLLLGLRINEDTHLQAQVAEWIPIGGDSNYAGAILHYHFSLNHLLYQIAEQVPLIGTLEFNGWSFQHGAFTAPDFGPAFQKAGDASYFSTGPGLRLFICEKVDFGIGVSFALSEEHWAQSLYRCELRLRF
jgi:hypothetical protein